MMMAEERVVCLSYEPHVWRRNKCKNCFHSKNEHKRQLKTQQSFIHANGRNNIDDPSQHLDYVDGMNQSDDAITPRFQDYDGRKDYREEMRALRRERKDIANKQAELRETMLRMEVQMHDYKETKQENDILTKDIQLMKKDLREVTQGAAKACEMNENLRNEVARLRQMVRNLGGDPKDATLLDAQYDSESQEMEFTARRNVEPVPKVPRTVESEPEISVIRKKRVKKEKPEEPIMTHSTDVTPLSRSVRERMARMEELLSSLRSVCISITNTPPSESKEVLLSFVESMVKGLESHCMNFVRKMYTQRAVSTPAFPLALRSQEATRISETTDLPTLSDIEKLESAPMFPRKSSIAEGEPPKEPSDEVEIEIDTPKIEMKKDIQTDSLPPHGERRSRTGSLINKRNSKKPTEVTTEQRPLKRSKRGSKTKKKKRKNRSRSSSVSELKEA